MTIKQLQKLAHGTKVTWRREFEDGAQECSGYVVDLRKSKPKAEPPLLYVQWSDGDRTDGSDDWALEHVSLAARRDAETVMVERTARAMELLNALQAAKAKAAK